LEYVQWETESNEEEKTLNIKVVSTWSQV